MTPALDRLRAGLHHRPRRRFQDPDFRPAAVLVPIIPRDGDLHLVFTQRTEDLSSHQGQVSFPGGKLDDDDDDLTATALREAHEEIGLDPRTVTPLGFLDDVPVPSQYVIAPVVGLVEPAPLKLVPNPREVAAIFEASLAELRAPGVLVDKGAIEWRGHPYRWIEYHVKGYRIWGATARMVHELLALV